MELPYSTFCSTAVALFLMKDGRYHMHQGGQLTTILNVSGHLLVQNELIDLFEECGVHGFSASSVILYDPSTKAEILGYRTLTIESSIDMESISTTNASGNRIWRYGENVLFVSPSLKTLMEQRFQDIIFGKGFEWFAASQSIRT